MPWNPSVQDRSGEILAAGLSSGLDSLIEGAQKGDERRKARRRAETVLGALFPEEKDSFAEKNLAELEGLLDAAALQRAQKVVEMQAAEGGRADRRLALDEAEAQRRAAAFGRELDMFAGEQSALRAAVAPGGGPAPRVDPSLLEELAQPGQGVLRNEERAKSRNLEMPGSAAQRYLAAGGADARMLDQLIAMDAAGAEGQFRPELVDLGGGAQAVTTSRKSAVPVKASTAKEDLKAFEIGGKRYLVGPGNKYFHQDGSPVRFSGGQDDALLQFLGGGAAGAAEEGEAAAPASESAPVRVRTKEERDALPKGARYIGPDGKVYTKG